MFGIVEGYVEDTFEQLNVVFETSYKVLRITNDLQLENLSASQADINYQLFISNVAYEDLEMSGRFNVNVRLEFFFNVVGKDYTAYKSKFDEYVYPFISLLVNDSRGLNYTIEDDSSVVLNDLSQIQVTNADRFEGDYYRPSVEFILTGITSSNANILSTDNVLA